MKKALCLSLAVCLSFALPAVQPAQAWPGGQGSAASRQRNDYLSFVREGIDELVRQFESAANARDAGRLATLYSEGAALVTPAGTVLGRELVRDRFGRALPRMRAVKLRVETLNATGEMAHVGGRLIYEVVHATGAHAYDVPVSLTLESHRSSWRIQTQVGGELPVFVVALKDTPANAAAGDTARIGVQVSDATGNPVPDVLVAFQLDGGSATLIPAVVSTNAQGIASTLLAMGSDGRVTVRATASALIGEPVIFAISLTEVAGKPGAKSSGAPELGRKGEQ